MILRVLGVVLVQACSAAGAPRPEPELQARVYGDGFWKHWGDGKAELSGYDLTYPRYGEERHGVAVAIFVTETFSEQHRVKLDGPDSTDGFPVMKLNLVTDFPTGIYDYNMMTSVFVGLTERPGRGPGTPAKISFSSQEWCGHVYHQLLPEKGRIAQTAHSYFQGEADLNDHLQKPARGFFADSLLLWARDLAAPHLERGQSSSVPWLPTLVEARLQHRPLAWTEATLSRGSETQTVSVPAGEFEVERFVAEVRGGQTWTILVEAKEPRRVIRWEASGGERGELLASDRLPYWQLNGAQGIQSLERLGLKPRPQHTP